jgi:hypothetical protein
MKDENTDNTPAKTTITIRPSPEALATIRRAQRLVRFRCEQIRKKSKRLLVSKDGLIKLRNYVNETIMHMEVLDKVRAETTKEDGDADATTS